MVSFAFTIMMQVCLWGGRIGSIPLVHVSQLRNSIKIRKNGGNKKRWSRFQYFCKFFALFISFTILSRALFRSPLLFITYYIKLLSWIQYQFTFGFAFSIENELNAVAKEISHLLLWIRDLIWIKVLRFFVLTERLVEITVTWSFIVVVSKCEQKKHRSYSNYRKFHSKPGQMVLKRLIDVEKQQFNNEQRPVTLACATKDKNKGNVLKRFYWNVIAVIDSTIARCTLRHCSACVFCLQFFSLFVIRRLLYSQWMLESSACSNYYLGVNLNGEVCATR